jgi:hypothetical protein
MKLLAVVLALCAGLPFAASQTYSRLGTCPNLGCILPPDKAEFLAGQYFDLRVEVHAPLNGTQARLSSSDVGEPDRDFRVTVRKVDSSAAAAQEELDFASFFGLPGEPEVEEWSFGYFEDLFAEDEGRVTEVNVASKAYRRICLTEPGRYEVRLRYYDGEVETAEWTVRPLAEEKKARNIILFIGNVSSVGFEALVVQCI